MATVGEISNAVKSTQLSVGEFRRRIKESEGEKKTDPEIAQMKKGDP